MATATLKRRGDYLYSAGDYPKAVDAYSAALKHDEQAEPGSEQKLILANLSAACNRLGKHREALDYATRCVACDPSWLQGHIRLAEVHRAMGNNDRAMEALNVVLTKAPDNKAACKMVDEVIEARAGLHTARRPLSTLKTPEQHARAYFFFKVMGIVLSMVALTGLVVVATSLFTPLRHWVLVNGNSILWMSSAASLGLVLVADSKQKVYPRNYQALTALAATKGLLLSVPCAAMTELGAGLLVMEAFALTVFLFGGLVTIPLFVERYDFTSWSRCCLMVLQAMLFYQVAGMFFGHTEDLAFLCGGVLLFCVLVVIDVQMVLERLGPDDAVKGAIHLYLDVLNLFMYILRILNFLSGGDRKRNNRRRD